MKMLKDLKLNPLCRVVWVSTQARNVWENTLSEINQVVQEQEMESVVRDERKCSWRTIPSETVASFSVDMANKGLFVLPVQKVGKWEGFSHTTIQAEEGKPYNLYCIISKTMKDAREYLEYFRSGSHNGQGEKLGFPKCCRRNFSENWSQGIVDPIYSIAENTPGVIPDPAERNFLLVKNAHPYSNPLLRYIGVRGGFHIPCSFNCQKSIRIATERFGAMKKDLVVLITALLSMPMSWDNYHGISVIRTPIFYIIFQSNPTIERYVVWVEGKFFPKEGAVGTEFPFRPGGTNVK